MWPLSVSPSGELQDSALQGGALGRPVCSRASAPQGPGSCHLIRAPLSWREGGDRWVGCTDLVSEGSQGLQLSPWLFYLQGPLKSIKGRRISLI